MLYFSYKVGPCFECFHVKCAETFLKYIDILVLVRVRQYSTDRNHCVIYCVQVNTTAVAVKHLLAIIWLVMNTIYNKLII